MEILKRRLLSAFWFTLALLFLLESWLWDHVKEWLRAGARALEIDRFEPWLTRLVAKLSPPMTLAIFAVPAATVLPFKIAALALIAKGHILVGLVAIFVAKTLALGVTAFLFDICRDKLLQMPWFAKFYSVMLNVQAWAHALVAPAREQIHEMAAYVRSRVALVLGDGKSSFSRRLAHLRELARRGGSA